MTLTNFHGGNSPREANCCFFPVPGGRPLLRFGVGVTIPGLGGAGVGDNANETDPSGPYFRGLPLFLFTGSPDDGPTEGVPPTLMPWGDIAEEGSTGIVEPMVLPPMLAWNDTFGFDKAWIPGDPCSSGGGPEPETFIPRWVK